ncbi:hypothetical protein KKC83_03015 [Patescibacteria group bacterium]|nr:hypothetical protein [Candidatus Falkowbacteria bacterium]MBU3905712.1 hypothetical protein [Patescibacteria group bacterium]MBU4014951.1 hypothetical protein [Patescibacteria group bacterium]MBU4026486.1 hypothetical protein [Patescibacteria group bacterium]MBU4072705.1 hypothetical protein [Patescibacteria group bacterium]
MYKDIFTQIGLSANEAVVYEYLLKNGESSAGKIIKKTPLKRGVVYNALTALVKKGLASQKTKDKVAYFSPDHPEKLRDFAEQKESEFKKAKNTLEANLSGIVSDFNLVSGKPGVRYFEGINGLKIVLDDMLTAKETICTFADVEAVVKYMEKLNREHAKKREQLNIMKKIIVIDTLFARNYLKDYHPKVSEFRFIDHLKYPFNSIVEIYDGKVAYISLSTKGIISMIINDKNIYQFNKSLFKFTWNRSKAYDQLPSLSNAQ